MRNHRLIAAILVALVAAGSCAATEMVFNGKTTTEWIAALASDSLEVQISAAWSLGEIGEHAVVAVPALLAATGDMNPAVRYNSIEALGKIGPGAAAAVPALLQLMTNPDARMRWRAAKSLGGIGPTVAAASIPLLATALGDADREVRLWSATSLGQMGPSAAGQAPVLINALGDVDPGVRYASARALGMIASATPPVVTALQAALGDPVQMVRQGATGALTALNQPVTQPAQPTQPTQPTQPAQPADPPATAQPQPTTPVTETGFYTYPGGADVLAIGQAGVWYPETDNIKYREQYAAPKSEMIELINLVEQKLMAAGRQLPPGLAGLRSVLQDNEYLMTNMVAPGTPTNGTLPILLDANVTGVGSRAEVWGCIVGLPGGQVVQGIPVAYTWVIYGDNAGQWASPLYADADAALREEPAPDEAQTRWQSSYNGHMLSTLRPVVGIAPVIVETVRADNAGPRRANLNLQAQMALSGYFYSENITAAMLGMSATDLNAKLSNLERALRAVTMAIGASVGADG
jgi:hypothetical protein